MNMREYIKKYKLLVKLRRRLYYYQMKYLSSRNLEKTTKKIYKKVFGKELNLTNPTEFNEKLQWLKLNNYTDNLIVQCADKYEMRNYIIEKNCEELLCNLYGVYERVEDIDFDKLPNKFALKGTHGCGYNIICKDKKQLDVEKTKKQLNKWLNTTFGYENCEPHYFNIKPRIICEEYLEDTKYTSLVDYKIYCFNGKPMYTLVCLDRGDKIKKIFYDLDWNVTDLRKDKAYVEIEKPACYDEMLTYAKKLSEPFAFVRVDFYDVNNKPIIGELTFTPAACLSTEYTEEAEMILGNLIELPN